MTEYKDPDDDRHYMLLGLVSRPVKLLGMGIDRIFPTSSTQACRMAMELGLRKSDPMSNDRNQRHDVRLWLTLFHAENR
jgi:hypothetical protein